MVIYRYKGKAAMYGQFAAFGIHLFYINFYINFQAGITYMANPANQFYNGTGWNGFLKIYFIAANGYHYLPAKTGGRNKGNLIHHVHGGAAKKGIVVVGGVRENGFKNARF